MIIKLFEEILRQNSRDTRLRRSRSAVFCFFFETAKPFHEINDLLIREIALAVNSCVETMMSTTLGNSRNSAPLLHGVIDLPQR